MNSDKKILYTFAMSNLGILLLVCFVTNNSARMVLLTVFSLLAAVLTITFIKKRTILELPKRQVALVMTAIAVISVTLYFMTGFKFGFSKVTILPSVIWKYLLPYILIISSAELTRRVLLAQKSKLVSAIAYISCILIDVLMVIDSRLFSDFEYFMDELSLVVLPAFAANALYHYISAKYGALPNILYKLIIVIYPFIIPLRPLMSNALIAFARIFLPVGILFLIRTLYTPKTFVVTRQSRRVQGAITALMMVVAMAFMLLVSSQFHYKALVIATESMSGAIDKGDAIVYEDFDGQIIQKGQVIVFERDNSTIVHRVMDIKKINGELRYYTKGDANEHMDSGYITNANVVGIINLKLKYFGYPTLWVRELFK